MRGDNRSSKFFRTKVFNGIDNLTKEAGKNEHLEKKDGRGLVRARCAGLVCDCPLGRPPAQNPAVDPAAVRMLKRMTDFMDGLQQFSVKTTEHYRGRIRFGAPDRSRPRSECDRQAAEQAFRRADRRSDESALLL